MKNQKVLNSPKRGNRHENMPTVNQAMKGRKIKKKKSQKFIHLVFSFVQLTPLFCLPVCSMILTNSSNQCHSFRTVSSVRQGGQSPPPPLKFWTGRTITEYFFQYNPVIIAGPYSSYSSVWQRRGGTFHLIEYDSNTVRLLLVSSY